MVQDVIAQANEIFLMFRTQSAILGHGCPKKPESRKAGLISHSIHNYFQLFSLVIFKNLVYSVFR